jgi:cation:H+ antiporter
MEWLLILGGLALLIASGELLVKGAVGLALKFKISVLVIGMTVVSFGTSAPELFVSIKAALSGYPDISLGNVIGSNIANISLILGITTIIFPIIVSKDTLSIDWPMMILSSVLLSFFMYNREIGFIEGMILFLLLVSFISWLIFKSRKANKKSAVENDVFLEEEGHVSIWKSMAFVLMGCVGLIFGGQWLLDGAVSFSIKMGVSERVIAITVIAFGTSVPELITSAVAAFRKETDISIGNLIGSNVFNTLGILGITGMVKEIPVSEKIMYFDMPWMLFISVMIFPLMFFGRKIGRVKGISLLLFYISYIYFILKS